MKLNKDLNKICGILLAKTLKDLYEDVALGDIEVGDANLANEYGFSYSFNCKERINKELFPKIIKQMKKNIDRAYKISYEKISNGQALDIFKDDQFKLELINDRKGKIDVVKFGEDFVDLCEQLSINKLSSIKKIELVNVAGVY
jgi:threonyl-tRNA synthetase